MPILPHKSSASVAATATRPSATCSNTIFPKKNGPSDSGRRSMRKPLLALEGSAERGGNLFKHATEVNCRSCHHIDSTGRSVGPDLSDIGTRMTPAEILASILRPSDKIDARYRTRQILTVEGQAIVGIVTEESDEQLTIVDSAGKSHTVPVPEIEFMQPSAKSGMPEQLLSGMTQLQAADLLSFLSTRRKIGPSQHKKATVFRATGPVTVDGRRDEAEWNAASPVGRFEFTWWNEGDGERQSTDARLLWDEHHLYVSFYCSDKDIQATRTERDSDVYRDDCVEIFASPEIEHPENYFNLEMNALGTQLDNYRPRGTTPVTPWNPDGIRVAVRRDGTLNDDSDIDRGWCLEAAIPFDLFAHVLPGGRPDVGDRWRLNLNRLENNMSVKSQWSRGDRNYPALPSSRVFWLRGIRRVIFAARLAAAFTARSTFRVRRRSVADGSKHPSVLSRVRFEEFADRLAHLFTMLERQLANDPFERVFFPSASGLRSTGHALP